MSELSQYWALVLPERGEFSGTWDVPLNANLTEIDRLLRNLHINRASNDAPTDNTDTASMWYDLVLSLLKIRTNGAWTPVVSHTHDGSIEGVPKINLATDILNDTDYLLPGNLIDTTGLNADTLDGYHLLDLAAQLFGTGLASSAGKLNLKTIGAAGTYIKITTDAYGRVVSGVNPTTIAGFGISDVYTKNEVLSNFAAINGIATKLFRVNSPVDGVSNPNALILSECAIPRGYAEANFAPLIHSHAGDFSNADHTHIEYALTNGDSSEQFEVAAPTDDTAAYDTYVIPRVYADTRYKAPFDAHEALTHIFADGSIQMTEDLLLSTDEAPVDDFAATSKAFVLSQIAALEAAKADLNGDTAETFLVAKAPNQGTDPTNFSKYALNIDRASELYSPVIHGHAEYIDQSGINQLEADITANLLSGFSIPTGMLQITEKQAIVSASVDVNGDTNFLSFSGQDIDILGASSPLRCVIARGFSSIGDYAIYREVKTDILAAFTLPTDDNTYGLLLASNKYNFTYNASDELINAEEIVLSEINGNAKISDLGSAMYLKLTGDETVYQASRKQVVFNSPSILAEATNITLDATGLTSSLTDDLPEDGYLVFSGSYDVYSYNVPDPTGAPGDIVVTPAIIDNIDPTTVSIYLDQYLSQIVREKNRVVVQPTLAQATSSATATMYTSIEATTIQTVSKIEYESTTNTISYSKKEPETPSLNDVWYDMSRAIGRKYDGATWTDRPFIELGEATVLSNVIANVAAKDIGSLVPEIFEEIDGPKFKITSEGGYAIKLTNRTGAASAKGTLVTADSLNDDSFVLAPIDSSECVGVVYDEGVADLEDCWIIISGIAEVLLEDGTGSLPRNWVVPSSTVVGRADATATTTPAGGDLAAHESHFKEIGHCIQTTVSGTDVLARCIIHFN
jgi:hypothetical protein